MREEVRYGQVRSREHFSAVRPRRLCTTMRPTMRPIACLHHHPHVCVAAQPLHSSACRALICFSPAACVFRRWADLHHPVLAHLLRRRPPAVLFESKPLSAPLSRLTIHVLIYSPSARGALFPLAADSQGWLVVCSYPCDRKQLLKRRAQLDAASRLSSPSPRQLRIANEISARAVSTSLAPA